MGRDSPELLGIAQQEKFRDRLSVRAISEFFEIYFAAFGSQAGFKTSKAALKRKG